jgi:hypothetical protein
VKILMYESSSIKHSDVQIVHSEQDVLLFLYMQEMRS